MIIYCKFEWLDCPLKCYALRPIDFHCFWEIPAQCLIATSRQTFPGPNSHCLIGKGFVYLSGLVKLWTWSSVQGWDAAQQKSVCLASSRKVLVWSQEPQTDFDPQAFYIFGFLAVSLEPASYSG